jgi:hypothetical protein
LKFLFVLPVGFGRSDKQRFCGYGLRYRHTFTSTDKYEQIMEIYANPR